MAHPDILFAYEEGLPETEEEQQQTNQEQRNPNNNEGQPSPPTNGKEKMPPMARHVPDPLKQLRQKHVAEVNLLAAQKRKRAGGVLREQAKIREAEAAEKTANAKRLKTPPSTVPNINADNTHKRTPKSATTQPATTQDTGDTARKDTTGTPLEDPKILPEAGKIKDKVNTPEGDASKISKDYTLSEEG
jgi:hypothetical protein